MADNSPSNTPRRSAIASCTTPLEVQSLVPTTLTFLLPKSFNTRFEHRFERLFIPCSTEGPYSTDSPCPTREAVCNRWGKISLHLVLQDRRVEEVRARHKPSQKNRPNCHGIAFICDREVRGQGRRKCALALLRYYRWRLREVGWGKHLNHGVKGEGCRDGFQRVQGLRTRGP